MGTTAVQVPLCGPSDVRTAMPSGSTDGLFDSKFEYETMRFCAWQLVSYKNVTMKDTVLFTWPASILWSSGHCHQELGERYHGTRTHRGPFFSVRGRIELLFFCHILWDEMTKGETLHI